MAASVPFIRPIAASSLVVLLVAGCAPSPDSDDASSVSDVVGGRAEAGFPSVGYMAAGTNARNLAGPFCAATLIGPTLAVTAAHCITMSGRTAFGIGFGAKGSSPIVPAKEVLVHPLYRGEGPEAYQHDVALLVLASAPRVVPAAVDTAAEPTGPARYVGYGRVTEGALSRTDGYTGERKSAAMTITESDALNVYTRGVDAGLCLGDSGGPLLSPTGAVIGVLGALLEVAPSCRVGNETVFSKLSGESGFLARGRACAAGHPEACSACTYACAARGYAEGACNQGWHCLGGCLVHDGC